MPRNVTFDTLKRASSESPRTRSEILSKTAASANKTVFLSHSSKDKELIPGAIILLENHGARVYVDAEDISLPSSPSPTTASVLKRNIQTIPLFVLFVTPNTKSSLWIPWELGLGDAYKKSHQLALLPASEDSGSDSWSEREYLDLYRRIVRGNLNGYTEPVWMVYDQHDNWVWSRLASCSTWT